VGGKGITLDAVRTAIAKQSNVIATAKGAIMPAILLWLLGIPIPIIILIALLT